MNAYYCSLVWHRAIQRVSCEEGLEQSSISPSHPIIRSHQISFIFFFRIPITISTKCCFLLPSLLDDDDDDDDDDATSTRRTDTPWRFRSETWDICKSWRYMVLIHRTIPIYRRAHCWHVEDAMPPWMSWYKVTTHKPMMIPQVHLDEDPASHRAYWK